MVVCILISEDTADVEGDLLMMVLRSLPEPPVLSDVETSESMVTSGRDIAWERNPPVRQPLRR